MQATHVINRMMVSPQPIAWYHRMYRRQMLTPVQPIDDPAVVIVRPYGIRKYLGMTQFPQDYTMMHYGGTLRGAKIGQWRKTLLVSVDPQPVNAPTTFAWRSSPTIHRFGNQWVTDDEEV